MIWMDVILAPGRESATAALHAGDVEGFLHEAGSYEGLELVKNNIQVLKELGLYERGLLHAFTMTKSNNSRYKLSELRMLFQVADRDRLRALGDPLPSSGPFTVFRGVAGNGPERRVRGLSWTASQARAEVFAESWWYLRDPAVFRCVVMEDDVLVYTNARGEEEFIVLLPPSARPQRVGPVAPEEKERIRSLIRDSRPDSMKG